MCRSIKRLRGPEIDPTDREIQEAALQFVRKVSGYRKPSKANEAAFNQAVGEIAQSTRALISSLSVRESRIDVHHHSHAYSHRAQ